MFYVLHFMFIHRTTILSQSDCGVLKYLSFCSWRDQYNTWLCNF